MLRHILGWWFRNRQTGAITIAQWPNRALWIVIVATILGWMCPSVGFSDMALEIVVNGGLMVWALDEIIRGVNPWRRCLGAFVAVYELATLLR